MNKSTEFEFSIPSISCLLSSLGSIGASVIHSKNASGGGIQF